MELSKAFVASLAYLNAEIIGWVYQTSDLPEVQTGDRLIIVDFSFKASVIEKWISQGIELIILARHKTAELELSRFLVGNFEETCDRQD